MTEGMMIHISTILGVPLDCSDDFGADFDITELMGRVVRVSHVARDEIVLELVPDEVPFAGVVSAWPVG
jgi:hypothetical protein